MIYKLNLTGDQHENIRNHLLSGDKKEAIVFALCGHRAGQEVHRLLVQEIYPVPYEQCKVRTGDRVTWSSNFLPPILDKASSRKLSVLKIHSHPTGYPDFSSTDNDTDIEFFPSVHSWVETGHPHASAIMLPGGSIFARAALPDGTFLSIDSVCVVGNDLAFWDNDALATLDIPDFAASHAQAFGAATFNKMRKLSIAVVGCSGTGSPVIEQLAQMGVGKLLLVDPDIVEERNLNRIINSTMEDCKKAHLKVDVMERAIGAMGLDTVVKKIAKNVENPDVVRAVAECDVIFGCSDGTIARHILNKISTYYSIPYFDVGVCLTADRNGGIEQICGSVHYLQPGKSSFFTRKVFTQKRLEAEYLLKKNPEEYKKRLQEKYIEGVKEDRLAVISVNMFFAALAVNEFLARLHPYRTTSNDQFASYTISLSGPIFEHRPEEEPCLSLAKKVGRGDVNPLLDLPALSEGGG